MADELGIGVRSVERKFSIGENDPLSARAEITERLMMRRGEWLIRVRVNTQLTADASQFRLRAILSAREGDEEVFVREWDESIPRDCL